MIGRDRSIDPNSKNYFTTESIHFRIVADIVKLNFFTVNNIVALARHSAFCMFNSSLSSVNRFAISTLGHFMIILLSLLLPSM